MATLIALGIAAYIAWEINRRNSTTKPIEEDVLEATTEAPTATSSNPVVEGPGHPKRWRKANESHKEVFARLNNIKPVSPLNDLDNQKDHTKKMESEHKQKTFERLIMD